MSSKQLERQGSAGFTLAMAAVLILLGGALLLGQWLDLRVGDWLWPLYIVVPGVVMLVAGLAAPGSSALGVAILGSIVTSTGLLLFYQNATGHWQSWAYVWALVAPGSTGAAQALAGVLRGRREWVKSGSIQLAVGVVLFVLGAVFFELLLGISGFGISFWDSPVARWAYDGLQALGRYGWPFFIIVPGVIVLLLGLVFRGDGGLAALIVGSIITTTGLLLLYQNFTGHWQSWAYAWALIAPTSIGVAQALHGVLRGRADLVRSGTRIAAVGLSILFVGVVFFELIIGISGFGLGTLGWSVLLIGGGVLLLLGNLLFKRRSTIPQE